MSILVLKSICAHLWLFAVLSVGHTEDVPRYSELTLVADVFREISLRWEINDACKVPPQPTNGKWKLHPLFCYDNQQDCDISEGALVKYRDRLIHTCDSGYRVEGDPVVHCSRKREWMTKGTIPSCVPALSVGYTEDVPRDPETTLLDIIKERLLRLNIESSCSVPPQPTNGKWKLHPLFCYYHRDCEISEGALVLPDSRLIHTCDSGYRVEGNPDVHCLGDEEWTEIPSCVRSVEADTIPSSSMTTTTTAASSYPTQNENMESLKEREPFYLSALFGKFEKYEKTRR